MAHEESFITNLTDDDIDSVGGGLLPFVMAGFAVVALAVTAFNAGYGQGKDCAENNHG